MYLTATSSSVCLSLISLATSKFPDPISLTSSYLSLSCMIGKSIPGPTVTAVRSMSLKLWNNKDLKRSWSWNWSYKNLSHYYHFCRDNNKGWDLRAKYKEPRNLRWKRERDRAVVEVMRWREVGGGWRRKRLQKMGMEVLELVKISTTSLSLNTWRESTDERVFTSWDFCCRKTYTQSSSARELIHLFFCEWVSERSCVLCVLCLSL